jgi:hypothetical protein
MTAMRKLRRSAEAVNEWPVWAGHAEKDGQGSRLCNARFLRTAARHGWSEYRQL